MNQQAKMSYNMLPPLAKDESCPVGVSDVRAHRLPPSTSKIIN